MDITLYKAAEALRETLDQVDPDTGELPEGYESALGLVKNKASHVGAYILQQEAQAQMVETHAKALLERVATQRRRHEWLRRYLMDNMLASGITQIDIEDGAKIKLYRDRDEAIEIFDERQVPDCYLSEPKPPPISKTKIKVALKSGVEVPGALLVKRHRLEIKP